MDFSVCTLCTLENSSHRGQLYSVFVMHFACLHLECHLSYCCHLEPITHLWYSNQYLQDKW